MEKYAAVILAAGKGTRMNEGQCSPIPKVMFEIAGKPIIDWSVKLVKEAGITKVVLVVGYKKELVENYFGDQVEYAVQEEQLGTGHAAAMAREILEDKAETLIIFGGDNPLFKPETVKRLIDCYEKERPTVAMLSVVSENLAAWAFGRIVRNNKNDVIGIVEQKDCNQKQFEIKEGNPAFYVFDAQWFWQNIAKIKNGNSQNEYYITDMIALAKEQGKRIIAVPVSEESEALGINNPIQQKEADLILTKRAAESGYAVI